jgi:Ribbon-helix-helix protein, copG family.
MHTGYLLSMSDESRIGRITISVPRGMGQLIDLIANASDLDKSKLIRRALDLYVKTNEGRFPKRVIDHYWKFRNRERSSPVRCLTGSSN